MANPIRPDDIAYILADTEPSDWSRTGTPSNRRYKLNKQGKDKFGFDFEISRRAYDQYVGRVKKRFEAEGIKNRKPTLENLAEYNTAIGEPQKPARGRTKQLINQNPDAYVQKNQLYLHTDNWISYENGYYKDFNDKNTMLMFVNWLKRTHPTYDIRIMKYVGEYRKYGNEKPTYSEGYATAYPTTPVLQFNPQFLKSFPTQRQVQEYETTTKNRVIEQNKPYLTEEEYEKAKRGEILIAIKPMQETNQYIESSPNLRIDWYKNIRNRNTGLWRVYFAERQPVQVIGEGIMPSPTSPLSGRRNMFIHTILRKQ